MWPPPNVQFLPSKEEIQKTKDEISTIEMEIIKTELRLDALRKSLLERKVWIAPIRTIPPEILSFVFTEAIKEAWKAPLVLQSVSRRWRNVVLDTPIAWSFIPLSKYSSKPRSEIILLFLERSQNAPLHIYDQDGRLLKYMKRLYDRIECIHLETDMPLLSYYFQCGNKFCRLERLKIDTWRRDSAVESLPTGHPSPLDMSLFPNLKVLDIKSRSSSLLSALTAVSEFPAIRHLTMSCPGSWGLSDLLIKCAMSLESVDLFYSGAYFEALDMVHFPLLRYLKLLDWSSEESRLHLKATTPNLQAHLDGGGRSTFHTVQLDTSSVVLLHVLCTPDLSLYPRLVTLCFSGARCREEEVIKAIECLQDNSTLCPDLALIEYLGEMKEKQRVKAEDALLAKGRVTGQKIQLMEGTVERRKEHAQMFKNLEPCGAHMPCKWYPDVVEA